MLWPSRLVFGKKNLLDLVYIHPGGVRTGIALFYFDIVSFMKHPIGHTRRNISKTNENPMISVLALVDFSLVEVSTGWAHTTSELKTHIPYPIPYTLYIIETFCFSCCQVWLWCGTYSEHESCSGWWKDCQSHPEKRLRWETLRKKFFIGPTGWTNL